MVVDRLPGNWNALVDCPLCRGTWSRPCPLCAMNEDGAVGKIPLRIARAFTTGFAGAVRCMEMAWWDDIRSGSLFDLTEAKWNDETPDDTPEPGPLDTPTSDPLKQFNAETLG